MPKFKLSFTVKTEKKVEIEAKTRDEALNNLFGQERKPYEVFENIFIEKVRQSPYHYRERNSGVTSFSINAMKHLKNLGKLKYIKAITYRGKYGWQPSYIVRGEHGTCSFRGFCHGYGGTGPQGLATLLTTIGISKDEAKRIAFNTPNHCHDAGNRVAFKIMLDDKELF